MKMEKIKEVIIVEGRYDKNTVSQAVNAHIIETGGFKIFSSKENMALLRKLAQTRGIIIFTDSDSAGFLIRNHIKGALNIDGVKHAYIPDIYGQEKRKRSPSKEGKLGVEGMTKSIIVEALRRAGATFEDNCMEQHPHEDLITKADLYELGLAGGKESAEKRRQLSKRLGLPSRISANALLDVINSLYTRSEFMSVIA